MRSLRRFALSILVFVCGLIGVTTHSETAIAATYLPSDANSILDDSSLLGSSGLYVGDAFASSDTRGVAEFDVSTSSAPLQSVILHLNLYGYTNVSVRNIDVYAAAGNGVVDSTDYNAGTIVGSFGAGNYGNYDVVLNATVIGNIISSSQFMALILRYDPLVPNELKLFADDPTLDLVATPSQPVCRFSPRALA
jgi:hypothetical protein